MLLILFCDYTDCRPLNPRTFRVYTTINKNILCFAARLDFSESGNKKSDKTKSTPPLQDFWKWSHSWTLVFAASFIFGWLSLHTCPVELPCKIPVLPTKSIAALVLEPDYLKGQLGSFFPRFFPIQQVWTVHELLSMKMFPYPSYSVHKELQKEMFW